MGKIDPLSVILRNSIHFSLNIPKKYASQIYKHWKFDWHTSWVWQCMNFFAVEANGDSILPYPLQWSMIYSFRKILILEINLISIPDPDMTAVEHMCHLWFNCFLIVGLQSAMWSFRRKLAERVRINEWQSVIALDRILFVLFFKFFVGIKFIL